MLAREHLRVLAARSANASACESTKLAIPHAARVVCISRHSVVLAMCMVVGRARCCCVHVLEWFRDA
eukprot:15438992-Alexandrium_andersonii.AAC.1